MAKKKGNPKEEEVKPEVAEQNVEETTTATQENVVEETAVTEPEFVSEEKVVDEVVSRPINGGDAKVKKVKLVSKRVFEPMQLRHVTIWEKVEE